MPSRYPLRTVLSLTPALVAVVLVACGGRGDLDSSIEVAPAVEESDAGLGTKPLDSGVGTKDDSGLGAKDSGLGTKDSGLGTGDDSGFEMDTGTTTEDAGTGTEDAGTGTEDSGTGTEDSGTTEDAGTGTNDSGTGTIDSGTGTHDAGMPAPDAGGTDVCFACAEQKCAKQTNACLGSPACVEEGECDLACLQSGHGVNALCLESCTKNRVANQELLSAISCAFTLCPKQCVGELTSLGGGALGGL
jgi:hypothetical protein